MKPLERTREEKIRRETKLSLSVYLFLSSSSFMLGLVECRGFRHRTCDVDRLESDLA
jgi:hypothetical protein